METSSDGPEEGATKKCPYCAETIQAEAIFCKHCRMFMPGIDPTDLDKENKKSNSDASMTGSSLYEQDDRSVSEANLTDISPNSKFRPSRKVISGVLLACIILLIIIILNPDIIFQSKQLSKSFKESAAATKIHQTGLVSTETRKAKIARATQTSTAQAVYLTQQSGTREASIGQRTATAASAAAFLDTMSELIILYDLHTDFIMSRFEDATVYDFKISFNEFYKPDILKIYDFQKRMEELVPPEEYKDDYNQVVATYKHVENVMVFLEKLSKSKDWENGSLFRNATREMETFMEESLINSSSINRFLYGGN